MTELFTIVASNVAVAFVLALCVCAAGRCLRRPALTHGLWILVLAKLVTPPLAQLPMGWLLPATAEVGPPAQRAAAVNLARQLEPEPAAEEMPGQPIPEIEKEGPAPAAVPNESDVADPAEPPPWQVPQAAVAFPAEAVLPSPDAGPAPPLASPVDWMWLAAALWLLGALAWFVVAGWRVQRFGRVLSLAAPAPLALQSLARDVAQRMGVRCPRVLVTSAPLSPLLWVFGHEPRLLLPAVLLARMDEAQQAALVAHELAHWRRRDHLVRWLEMVVLGCYWWCPLAWWARAELQQAEEECCDAWVVWALPGAAKSYALALMETIDFLSGATLALPPAASGIGHVRFLKRRLTMILRGQTPRALTAAGILGLLGIAALLLPLAPGWGQDRPANRKNENQNNQRDTQNNNQNDNNEQQGAGANQTDKVREEAQRLQAEIANLRAELEKRMAVLHKLAEAQGRAPGDKAGKDQPPRQGGDRGPNFGPKNQPQGGDRLHEVERKLDLLLWEIQAMRRELQGHRQQGPGGPGRGNPGGPPPGGGQPGGPGGNPGPGGFPGGQPGGPGGGGPGAQPPGNFPPPRQSAPQGQPPLGPGLIPANPNAPGAGNPAPPSRPVPPPPPGNTPSARD